MPFIGTIPSEIANLKHILPLTVDRNECLGTISDNDLHKNPFSLSVLYEDYDTTEIVGSLTIEYKYCKNCCDTVQ